MTNEATEAVSLRDRILAFVDIDKETVEVKQWGNAAVEIRSMSGRERAKMLADSVDDEGKVDFLKFYPRLIIHCAYDPDSGEKLFTDSDEESINDKNGGALEQLAQVALRLSGLSNVGSQEVGKDSAAHQNGSSTTS
jgi:hypothetical protein